MELCSELEATISDRPLEEFVDWHRLVTCRIIKLLSFFFISSAFNISFDLFAYLLIVLLMVSMLMLVETLLVVC